MTTAANVVPTPTLPRTWRGSHVHVAHYAEPVAILGDLHGRADLLARLLPLLGHRPLLVTGDVGDRGPDTRGVLDMLIARGALGVIGNHDLWLARTRPADLLWRASDPETMLPVDRPIVMGHRQVREPLDTGEVIAIDTGAGGPDGRLTALLLPERRFLTVG